MFPQRKVLHWLSLWRGVADVRAATGAPQMFVNEQLDRLKQFLATVFQNYKEGCFPPWFRPRPLQTKRVLANWNMIRHFLRLVAVKLQHACALASHEKKMDYPVFSISPRSQWRTDTSVWEWHRRYRGTQPNSGRQPQPFLSPVQVLLSTFR